jgi:hypothetical protein
VLLHDAAIRREHHDHRFHGCDLPPPGKFLASLKAHGRILTACRYTVPYEVLVKSCGCRMCTQHLERRHDRRRSRHESNIALRHSNIAYDD